jgi:GAF domain-containing protein
MSSAFFQPSFAGSSTIVMIAVIVLVMAVGLALFLFARWSMQRRESEGHMRDQMLEMERDAQFAAAAERIPVSRRPVEVAHEIASLLREHVSLSVLAIYAGSSTSQTLSDALASSDTDDAKKPDSSLPSSISASMVAEHQRPAMVRQSIFWPLNPSDFEAPKAQPPSPAQDAVPAEVRTVAEAFVADEGYVENQLKTAVVGSPLVETVPGLEQNNGAKQLEQANSWASNAAYSVQPRSDENVMILPWHGPFNWNGLIVASSRATTPESLDRHRDTLNGLTDKLAVALEFELSDEHTEANSERASRTADFSRAVISCLEHQSPLDSIVQEVAHLVSSDSAAMWRVDKSGGMIRVVALHGLEAEFLPLPVGQGLAGNVAQSGEVLAIEDAPSDSRCIFPREARESGVVSYLGAPLVSDDKMLGVIEVHSAERRSWTKSERLALESAAKIISEFVKSTDSKGNRLRVESAYLGLSESLQRLRSAEEVKEAVVEVLGAALGASRVMIVELKNNHPEPVAHEYHQPSVQSAKGTVFGDAFVTGIAESKGSEPITISNSLEHSLSGKEVAAQLELQSELAARVIVDGKTHAIVYVHQCDRQREWDHEEIEFAERVAQQLALSLTNIQVLETAYGDARQAQAVARQAQADAQRATEISREAPTRIQELERKLAAVEQSLTQSRTAEEQARVMLAQTNGLESKARAEADVSRRVETEVRQQLQRLQEEHKQAQGSARQLLEINRLKSEFIVNAGHEMEASLQSVLGLAELLERGSYGTLTPEQREAVHGIYTWARRLKNDIDWLVEYGSARSRRLESTAR